MKGVRGVEREPCIVLMDFKILSLNVRGLGNRDKRVTINHCIKVINLVIFCIQVSKIQVMSELIVCEI